MTKQQEAQFVYNHIIKKVANGGYADGNDNFAEEVFGVLGVQMAAKGVDMKQFDQDQIFGLMDRLSDQIIDQAKQLQAA